MIMNDRFILKSSRARRPFAARRDHQRVALNDRDPSVCSSHARPARIETLPAVMLRDFSAGYEDRAVLHSINAVIRRERTTALVGPGRSSKSTLLKAIAGVRHDSLWTSRGLWRLPGATSVLRQTSRLSNRSLAQSLPHRRDAGLDPAVVVRQFWHPVAPMVASELSEQVERPMAELPRPLRRLAEFTVAASTSAPLLLLDEPDAGMGDCGRWWIRDKLAAMRGQRTIVLVTHNLQLARAASDDTIFLLDGEVIESGATERMFTRPLQARTRTLLIHGS